MKSLKSLELIITECGSWDELLHAVSKLELLKHFKLDWNRPSIQPSERGLLYLANGQVRHSLVSCEIQAQAHTRYAN
eukprot:CAMPEP_0184712352 /NCGR_PEP_ID=MMETSP0314-20130426/2901_1 /TAXON_ID=38298 /ORGANISM="Rhodella maculata, Strain CCMP 736" /LENGTH=76 /DNA_ID=CAMNT_0027174765 /DNA_START=1459 /DNA_END=1686 /DNA_ORIENTATION=-